MMNLYSKYNTPKELVFFDVRHTTIPLFAFGHARNLKKPFKAGEKVIAKSPRCSLLYAIYVLKKRFVLGENSIIMDVEAPRKPFYLMNHFKSSGVEFTSYAAAYDYFFGTNFINDYFDR